MKINKIWAYTYISGLFGASSNITLHTFFYEQQSVCSPLRASLPRCGVPLPPPCNCPPLGPPLSVLWRVLVRATPPMRISFVSTLYYMACALLWTGPQVKTEYLSLSCLSQPNRKNIDCPEIDNINLIHIKKWHRCCTVDWGLLRCTC
jgi:hypothetical protein